MPDFMAEDAFLLCKGLMLAFSWDEEQAIQHLEATWWQVHPEHNLRQDLPLPPQQECQEGEQMPQQEERDEQAQEKKKPTIGDFEEDIPPPNVIALRPSQYVIQKVVAYEYMELWYFTKEGCFKATKQVLLELSDCVIWTNPCMYMYTHMYVCKCLYNMYIWPE